MREEDVCTWLLERILPCFPSAPESAYSPLRSPDRYLERFSTLIRCRLAAMRPLPPRKPRVSTQSLYSPSSASQRQKLDSDDDRTFYSYPRFVKHVDERFLAQLTALYRERIPENAVVLDMCSSWVSHLPPEKKFAKVVGHGLNAEELMRNPQLDEWFVRNLNTGKLLRHPCNTAVPLPGAR